MWGQHHPGTVPSLPAYRPGTKRLAQGAVQPRAPRGSGPHTASPGRGTSPLAEAPARPQAAGWRVPARVFAGSTQAPCVSAATLAGQTPGARAGGGSELRRSLRGSWKWGIFGEIAQFAKTGTNSNT